MLGHVSERGLNLERLGADIEAKNLDAAAIEPQQARD